MSSLSDSSNPLDEHWHALLATALLGTDRRDPPQPIAGPLGDLVADTARSDPSARMLADVAACVTVRRAAFVPAPPADRLAPPRPDLRPMCSASAAATWRVLHTVWPVLEDEWVLTVLERGYKLAPDLAVELLEAHRRDPVRTARVMMAAGPLADWLIDHVPSLAATKRSAPGQGPSTAAERVTIEGALVLPELPIPPELEAFRDADAHSFGRAMERRFSSGRIGAPERPVLVNLLARCRPEVLIPAAEVLEGFGESSSGAVALVLADLARTRDLMLSELAVSGSSVSGSSVSGSG
jgi:hypothetical protein